MFGMSSRKQTTINTRLGKTSDVRFVLSEVQKGLIDGQFYFDEVDGLAQFEK